MSYMEIDTPHGRLSITWPEPQGIYSLDAPDPFLPVAYFPPQDPGPYITLDGQEITRAEADAIIAEMRGVT